MPKSLSIVIPAHDEERLLRRCLQAIADQKDPPEQVIVVDNNSTDGTADVARSFPFVTLVHEPRQGIVYARNLGFGRVTGDIIGRIDADTVLPPTWTRTVRQFYEAPETDHKLINGGAHFYNLHSGWLTGRGYDFIVHRLNRVILGYYFPWGSNMAMPAAAWREVRPHICERTDVHEDLDLGIHLHDLGYETVYRPRMRVGAVARRITDNRGRLWMYLRMWVDTMRLHRARLWPLTWLLSIAVWVGSYCVLTTEKVCDWLTTPIDLS